ncbi:MAG: histidine kinase [Massilia sp.]
MQSRRPEQLVSSTLSVLHRGFDATATWVSQLSWWKFFLFAALALIAGSILQAQLFSGGGQDPGEQEQQSKRRPRDSNILIDDSGIHFTPKPGSKRAEAPEPAEPPEPPQAAEAPEAPEPHEPAETPDTPATAKPAKPEKPAKPAKPPKAGDAARLASATTVVRSAKGDEVHIDLPPQISEELSSAIENLVDETAEAKASRYHKQASTWFTSFVWLLVLALFGTKALVGGKKRAEAETEYANAAAERESMQRQLSEAKMQMMQAQVEPHFLFNTLASVEHLIETNPPRASAMQRSLIQYLRAVLPQMRENAVVTNLGREVDMVRAYLNLLKMRMEERLTVEIDVPEALRAAAFPPMMLQSMVENAIKHGLECKPAGGTLTVRVRADNDKLQVSVIDDGVGFGVVPSDGTGLGLMTIRERLKLLHGERAGLHIAPNTPSGVIATVEVPFQRAK